MARDILAVPVSTVASEAAFSTGGHVLYAFRSSLSAKIVQSLICAQDCAEANDGVSPDPVLDVDGNELKTGTNYYVLSTFRPGGGLSLYPLPNKNITSAVAQLVFGQGLPVVFDNGGTDLGEVVRESTDLTISFAPGMLFSPAEWKVVGYDEAAENHFVVAGESDGDESTVNNRFQIRKNSSLGDYRFFFCPKDCSDVGIYVEDDGIRRLALEHYFFSSTFMFKAAC
ncbi:kunitz trypsin inhibitor 5-like [Henckelia pumila]|uniref:kunitz trypsin inhibitor 5-like n=1 Tax=Henckelia pumila TaxID=405737 RepID=UPI003C6DFCD6